MSSNFSDFLNVAIEAAQAGGRVLLERFGTELKVEHKGFADIVTDADKASEKEIMKTIRRYFPDHAFLNEEAGHVDGNGAYTWIVDPLDGTTNFAHGFPCFVVNVAFAVKGEVVAAATYDPTRDEMVAARKGGGTTLNGEPVKVSRTASLEDSLLVTGFPYRPEEAIKQNLVRFGSFLPRCQAVRRLGSAGLDLVNVALGRFDGFWQPGLYPWDLAAGVLLVREAGGKVTNMYGREFDLFGRSVLATNGLIHEEMLRVILESVPEPGSDSDQ